MIEARELRIVDAEGRTTISLESDEYGGRVRVYSVTGAEVASIEVTENGGAVYTFGEDHVLRTFMGAVNEGGLIDARTPAGYSGARLFSGGFGGALFTFDFSGELSTAVTPQDNGGMIEVYQVSNATVDSEPATDSGADGGEDGGKSVSRVVLGFSQDYGYLQIVNADDFILTEVTATEHGGVVTARSHEGYEFTRLGCVEDGGQVVTFNRNGDAVASLLVHNDSGALQVRDATGLPGIELLTESETGIIRTFKNGEMSTISTSTDHGGAFMVFDAETGKRVAVFGAVETGGSIEALTIDGALVSRLMAAREGGALLIYDNERQLRGAFVINSGDGYVETYRSDDRLSGQLGGGSAAEPEADDGPHNGEAQQEESIPAVRQRPPY
ncbi:MAG: hypothetical protein EA376_06400 [Phycisphaeraceae bacterium]|nr:MAG: hypothetical protein EA376_06400 [Phycisphaeraceae bacterium]